MCVGIGLETGVMTDVTDGTDHETGGEIAGIGQKTGTPDGIDGTDKVAVGTDSHYLIARID